MRSRFVLAVAALSMLVNACVVDTTTTAVRAPAADSPAPVQAPTAEPQAEVPAPTETPPSAATSAVEPTLAFLAQAIARTNEASSFRFQGYSQAEVFGFSFGDRAQPFLFGEVAGDRSRTSVDRTNFVSDRVRSTITSDEQLTLTIVTDGLDGYVTSPYYAILIGGAGLAGSPMYKWVEEVATGWGRVSLESVSHADILGSVDIGTGRTGTRLLDLLDRGTQVLDGGAGNVSGVPTQILITQVTLLAIVELSGQDPNDFLTNSQVAMLADINTNVEVHVDANDFVRRIEYVADFTVLEGGGAGTEQTNWQRVDYFDFDADIQVEIPSEWVEVTDDLAALVLAG